MSEAELLLMSQRERDRLKVLHEVAQGHLTQRQTAGQLGLTDRGVRKLLGRLRKAGDGGVVHRLRGRASKHKIPDARRERILVWGGRRYADFGPPLAAEKLAQEGLGVSRETRRKGMRSRSPGLKRGRVLRMGTEERKAQDGITKELRLKAVNRQPMVLRAVEGEKLIEPDHAARAIGELVGRLDLSGLRAEIESVEGEAGRPAYDPQLLISLWIYAYSEGVSSAREMAAAVRIPSRLSGADRMGGGKSSQLVGPPSRAPGSAG